MGYSPTPAYETRTIIETNVLDCGAVGGNEAVDTAAFLKALTLAGTDGRVAVPWAPSKLAYVVTPGVLNLLDGQNLVAKGHYPQILKGVGGAGIGYLVTALGVIRPRIAGIRFRGTATKTTGRVIGDGGLHVQGCDHPVVEDCEVEGMGWDGIAFDAFANNHPIVRRNWVHDSANHGLSITSGKGYTAGTATAVQTCQDAEAYENFVENVGNFGQIYGYLREPTVSINIAIDPTLVETLAGVDPPNMVSTDPGLTIEIPGAGPAGADLITTIASWIDATHVHITDPASTSVVNVQSTVYSLGQRYNVHDNVTVGSGGPGIQFYTLTDLNASNNRTSNCPTGFLYSLLRHSKIDGSKASNSSPTNSYSCAMYINLCDDVMINDPDVYHVDSLSGGGGEGIRVISNGLLNLPIHINHPKVYSTASHGIEVLASDVCIDGHDVSACGTLPGAGTGWGIYLNACVRPRITNGVRTEGNVSGGITASGAVTGATVTNNDISNVAAVGAHPPGINLSPTSTGRWTDNNIHDIGTGRPYVGIGAAGTVIRELTNSGFFGDGIDGPLHFDGISNVVLADGTSLVPVANVYTLTRDIFPTTCLIDAIATVKTVNFRIICSVSFDNEGTVQNNGNDAAGAVAGTGAAIGTLVTAGGAGGTGVATLTIGNAGNTPGSNANYCAPGAGGGGSGSAATGAPGAVPNADGWASHNGGTGGAAGTGGATGGAGGAANLLATRGPMHHFSDLGLGLSVSGPGGVSAIGPGGGGGAGAGDGAFAGGGGGGGAGVVFIIAPTLISNGSIFARGGKGGDSAGGNSGGGGGGGGGMILLVGNSLTVGTASVTGGARGNKTNNGTNGAVGGTGTVQKVTLTM